MKLSKSLQIITIFWLQGNSSKTVEYQDYYRGDGPVGKYFDHVLREVDSDGDFFGLEERYRTMSYIRPIKRNAFSNDLTENDEKIRRHNDEPSLSLDPSKFFEATDDDFSAPPYNGDRYARNSGSDVAQSSCPAHTEWRILHSAKDINNTEVQVFQPEVGSDQSIQWFYTVTCKNNALRSRRECIGCCIGTDHSKFKSSCRQKKSYVKALIRKPRRHHYEWSWIQLDASCNCAVTHKHHDEF